jgi:hypothetical protein
MTNLKELYKQYPWKTFKHFYPLAHRILNSEAKDVRKFLNEKVNHDRVIEKKKPEKQETKITHMWIKKGEKTKFPPIYSKTHDAFQFDTFFTPPTIVRGKKITHQWLVFININTKKAYAFPMRDKTAASALLALRKMIATTPVKSLQSDQDSAYLSNDFIQFLEQNNIKYTTVTDNDHHVLGVINRFIRTVRDHVKIINEKNLKNFIDEYNKSPHESLKKLKQSASSDGSSNGISPNDMTSELEDEFIKIKHDKKKLMTSHRIMLPIGARVRITLPKKPFEKKRTNFSNEAYIIDNILGNQYQIRALDGSVDLIPWFYVIPVKKGEKIKTAKTIKNNKRKVVKKILSFDERTQNFKVQYTDGTVENIPKRNIREGAPATMPPIENVFWKSLKES